MKKIAFLLSSLLTLSLCGCSKDDLPFIDRELPKKSELVVLILDKNNNSNNIIPTSITSADKIKEIYNSIGNLCIVVSDGNPSILCNDDKRVGYLNETEIKTFIEKYRAPRYFERELISPKLDEIVSSINECAPDDDESDLLKSLQLASEIIKDMENKTIKAKESKDVDDALKIEKKIIICSTGLSTTGNGVNFCSSDWNSFLSNEEFIENSERIDKMLQKIDDLSNRNEIPDLSQISVEWYGIGQVSQGSNSTQDELEKLTQENLKTIWKTILDKANASTSNQDNTYFISEVFDESKIKYDTNISPVTVGTFTISEIELGGFVGNSAEFLNIDKAKKALFPLATSLKRSGIKYLLVGTTANDNTFDSLDPYKLSKDRAEAVKSILIEMDVPENQLITIGLGINAPWHEDELNYNGDVVESIAKRNRAVVFKPYDSNEAKLLLKTFG